MKPQNLAMTEHDDKAVRVEATFAAEDIDRVYEVMRRILAYSCKIDSTSGQDLPRLLLEKLGQEELERRYVEGIPQLLAPWVVDALDFQTILEPVVAEALQPIPGAPYTFSIDVVPKPLYELDSYEPVTVVAPSVEMPADEIRGYMTQIAFDTAPFTLVEEDRPVQEGDHVVASIQTFRQMEPILALTDQQRAFDVGEGWFAPEFDENLTGMRVGESKTFTFESLGVYSQNAEDTETLTTTVTIKEVSTRAVPEINDEWVAQEIPGVQTVEEFEKLLQGRFAKERAGNIDRILLASVAEALVQRLDISISDKEYEHAVNENLRQMEAQAQQQNISFGDLLAARGLDEQSLGDALMQQAYTKITQGYALDAYARHFELKLDDADIDAVLIELSGGRQSAPIDSIRQQYEQGGHGYLLREAALRLKANKAAAAVATVRWPQR